MRRSDKTCHRCFGERNDSFWNLSVPTAAGRFHYEDIINADLHLIVALQHVDMTIGPLNAVFTDLGRFAARCGAHIPQWLDDAFDAAIRDDRQELLSTAVCTELCSDLLDGGVEDLHFYTLNKPELTRDVCAALGVTPKVALAEVA